MSVRVKICGITRPDDALEAVACGADALGFNFWPGSKRHIESSAALAISRKLPPLVMRVGVFVNQPPEEIARIAREVGLSAIQLHGDEGPRDCLGFDRPVIKAIRVTGAEALTALQTFDVAGFLLDAPSAGFGGSGQSFDWSHLRGMASGRIILAGGLTPENISAAIHAVQPHAVDVASGVESSPGIKDPQKLRRFIRAAKESP